MSQKIIKFLTENPGYTKSGNKVIAERLGVSEKSVQKVKGDIRKTVYSEKRLGQNPAKIDQPGTYIVSGCNHIPFHNKPFFNAFLNFMSDINPNGLVLAGDFMDMQSLSSHDRGKKPLPGVTLDWEYSEGNKALDQIDDIIGNKPKFYLFGNHEDRYLRYMRDIDNSKLGESLPSPDTALNLVGRGYNVFTNWKSDSVGIGEHLEVSHGEFTNVHVAKKTIDTYRKSCIFFHTHRVQSYIEGQTGAWNGGTMSDFENSPAFSYATRAMIKSWLHGFIIVNLDNNGFYNVQQIIWYKDRFFVGNKCYM